MPEKTVRDMSAFERKQRSLEARTFRAIVLSCAGSAGSESSWPRS